MGQEVVDEIVDLARAVLSSSAVDAGRVAIDGRNAAGDAAQLLGEQTFAAADIEHPATSCPERLEHHPVVVDVVIPAPRVVRYSSHDLNAP